MVKRVVLAGGSGFLGQALAGELRRRDYAVTILTRTPRTGGAGIEYRAWDGATPGGWASALEGAAAVVNLTGRSVNCLPTPANRREILASRLDSVRVIDAAIGRCAQPPGALVQAGSLAIYGDAGDRICAEDAPHGRDFSADVCEQWEAAFAGMQTPRTRRALLRVGFALGCGGGALEPLAKLARCFLGGTVGRGRQYISWVHVDDLNEMFIQAIERPEIAGAYNATGPTPVTNAEFMRELRRAAGRPWSPPVPAWAVRFGAHWFLRTDADLALTGRRCVPRRFLEQGFRFQHTELAPALRDLLSHP
ncbi:MAG TPA: TIGR01777 family oxidoreductase [Opitutaceae bacterium]|nr:TIGR01777 family oxidoreductase [Opitutaceae bacterium]